MNKDLEILKSAVADLESADYHRNAPRPDKAALYGLVGDIALAGAENSEANPYAIALNVLAYLGVALGRSVFLQVGDTYHHPRLFTLHVGRSSVARKGDATSLLFRIDEAMRKKFPYLAPQIHRGGLSSREGLIRLIHDAYKDGKDDVPGVDDKRLLVAESEFANVLQQNKREGNTLSAALRDCWDGGDLKPATKQNPMWASNPHIAVMGAITPSELKSLIARQDLTNGFFNRFLVIFAERQSLVPMPTGTPRDVVEEFADRIAEVLQFIKADRWVERNHTQMTFSDEARAHYERLYRGPLNDCSMGERIAALIHRRPPMLLRMSMLFALCDLQTKIEVCHLDAAMAWIHYSTESVKFIFATGAEEAKSAETQANAEKILEFLAANGKSSRSTLSAACFGKHKNKQELDEAIEELLGHTPPSIVVKTVIAAQGHKTKFYCLSNARSAKPAKLLSPQQNPAWNTGSETGEVSEIPEANLDLIRSLRQSSHRVVPGENPEPSMDSQSPQTSHKVIATGELEW